ncbi:MAG: tRNA (adenosine(37)-N6)-threonylcarbamoyltransferase complex ATPase subunit type 1 TsaE [Chitinivibrionales bacterium]|nr:tRNA (adenosine(37)-N6)-threonylcarbamoyltransferase complex ATPase subunit type 1 TsaE [Chitinivibrionales bacterium]
MSVTTRSADDTRSLGAKTAAKARVGETYALIGELGAGKTEFVRGFVDYLNPQVKVQSPSFTILRTYQTRSFPVYHFDFYRLSHPDELIEIGFADYVGADGVCLIEWADRFPEVLPEDVRTIRFSDRGDDIREIEVA